MNIVKFHDQELSVTNLDGQVWLRGPQIGGALGFANPRKAIPNLFKAHKSEFTPDMTTVLELPTAGGMQMTRIFSARGAALLAMLAKTERAAEFRAWVLDVLEARTEVRSQRSEEKGLSAVLTGTKKPYGWDIWPHVAHYARLGLDAAEISRLLDRKKDYISKTLQAMRKAGAIASHALTGRPMRPLLPSLGAGLVGRSRPKLREGRAI